MINIIEDEVDIEEDAAGAANLNLINNFFGNLLTKNGRNGDGFLEIDPSLDIKEPVAKLIRVTNFGEV